MTHTQYTIHNTKYSCGTPEQVARNKNSYTGQYLAELLKKEKVK